MSRLPALEVATNSNGGELEELPDQDTRVLPVPQQEETTDGRSTSQEHIHELLQMRDDAICRTVSSRMRSLRIQSPYQNLVEVTFEADAPALVVIHLIRTFRRATYHFVLFRAPFEIIFRTRDVTLTEKVQDYFHFQRETISIQWEPEEELVTNLLTRSARPQQPANDMDFLCLNNVNIEGYTPLRRELATFRDRYGPSNLLAVYLDDPWGSWLKRTANWNPKWHLVVQLVDKNDHTTGAIDQGGPIRQFMQCMCQYMVKLPVFVGDDYNKVLVYNHREMCKKTYYNVGAAIALMLTAGGPAPNFLGEVTVGYILRGGLSLVGKLQLETLFAQGVLLAPIYKQIIEVEAATTEDQLQDIVYNSELLADAGFSNYRVQELQKNKQEISEGILHYTVVARHASAYIQFMEGLGEGVVNILRRHPDEFEELCREVTTLTANSLYDHFTLHHHENNAKKALEEKTLEYFKVFLENVENEDIPDLKLNDILEAVTGLREWQALGYDTGLHLKFHHDGDRQGQPSKLPLFQTCAQEIVLPAYCCSYEDFQHQLRLGILGSARFISDQA